MDKLEKYDGFCSTDRPTVVDLPKNKGINKRWQNLGRFGKAVTSDPFGDDRKRTVSPESDLKDDCC